MADNLPEPKSRKEEFLAKAAGMNGVTLPEPASREEEYLNAIAEGGGGGGVNVVQTTGTSTTDVMSQNAVTEALASAGGPTVVQTTGTSTTDVMSQDATTKLIYPDIVNHPYRMIIGDGSIGSNVGLAINGTLASDGKGIAIGYPSANALIGTNGKSYRSIAIGVDAGVGKGDDSIAIGYNAFTKSSSSVDAGNNIAIGLSATVMSHENAVALGSNATVSRNGEVNVGAGTSGNGYNSTNYRVIGGVHDPIDAHDAATKGYVDAHSGGGGGAIKLTAADYNYDTNGGSNYNTIAIWLLPDDIYQMPDSGVSVTGAISGSNYNHFNLWINNRDAKYFIKSNNKFWFMADPSSGDSTIGIGAPFYYCIVNPNNGNFYVNLDVQLVTKSQLPS